MYSFQRNSRNIFKAVFLVLIITSFCLTANAKTYLISIPVTGSYTMGQSKPFTIDLGEPLYQVNEVRFICQGTVTAGLDYWMNPYSDKFYGVFDTDPGYMGAFGPYVGAGTYPMPEPFSANILFESHSGATWDFLLDGQAAGTVYLDSIITIPEFPPKLPASGHLNTAQIQIDAIPLITADIDHSGKVDLVDFAILASQWLQPPGVPSADIAPPGGDNIVNSRDLGLFVDNWPFPAPTPVDPNLKGWWKFDEGSGTTAYDSVGNNDGTITGASWLNDPCRGMCLSFDGNDYVALSSFTVSTNNGTISLWFKTSADFSANYGSQGYLISQNGKYRSYLSVVGNGTVPYWIYGETDSQDDYFVAIDGAAPVDAWSHIVVSFYNKTAKTYLNGELIQTEPVTDSSLTLTRIGGRTEEFFNGKIDDVRIYDRALLEDEIQQLYQEGSE